MIEYMTALYIRLSQEDDNIGESNSVKHQRDLLTGFVMKHPDLSKGKLLYFVDDGHSGTNFDRPAVKDMLNQVRKGSINCIVVKDFSRFGRNYIEVGGYLDQVFPFLNVRFISVNDFFDSNDNKGSSPGLDVGFKTLIHDLYSKDLSVKSKTGKMAKIKKGEHVNGTAPFGYVKSKTVKNAWEIDEAAAVSIRKIYGLAIDGLSACEIARQLNSEGVAAPLAHRINNNTEKGLYCRKVDETPLWRMANVSRILRDERYTGKVITGTKKRMTVGGRKTKPVSKSDWIVIPNAHEPIVSQETFDKVQELRGPYNQRSIKKVNANIFAGKIFCGHCRHALRRYGGLEPKYICQSHRETQDEKCLQDVIYEVLLKDVVLTAIKQEVSLVTAVKQEVSLVTAMKQEVSLVTAAKQEVSLAYSAKKQAEELNGMLHGECENLSGEIKRLSDDVRRLKNNRESLFEDLSDGRITKEQYVLTKSAQADKIRQIESEIVRLSDKLYKQNQNTRHNERHEMLKPFDKLSEVTPEMMALVDGIYIFDSTCIEIKFSFTDGRCQA